MIEVSKLKLKLGLKRVIFGVSTGILSFRNCLRRHNHETVNGSIYVLYYVKRSISKTNTTGFRESPEELISGLNGNWKFRNKVRVFASNRKSEDRRFAMRERFISSLPGFTMSWRSHKRNPANLVLQKSGFAVEAKSRRPMAKSSIHGHWGR